MTSADSIVGRLRRGVDKALLAASPITFGALFAIGRAERVKAFEQALLDAWRTVANITQVAPDDDRCVNLEPEALGESLAGRTCDFRVWDAHGGGQAHLVVRNPCADADAPDALHLGGGLSIVRTCADAPGATLSAVRRGNTVEVRLGLDAALQGA